MTWVVRGRPILGRHPGLDPGSIKKATSSEVAFRFDTLVTLLTSETLVIIGGGGGFHHR